MFKLSPGESSVKIKAATIGGIDRDAAPPHWFPSTKAVQWYSAGMSSYMPGCNMFVAPE